MVDFKANVEKILDLDYGKTVKTADKYELYNAVSKAAMSTISGRNGLDAEGKKTDGSANHIRFTSDIVSSEIYG